MELQTKGQVKLYGNLNGAVPQGVHQGAELASGDSEREVKFLSRLLSIPTVENMIRFFFFFLSKSPRACVIVTLFYG